MSWGTDARTLFVIAHAPAPAPLTAEGSPYFDLMAVSMINDATVRLVQNVGMFAYPSASPIRVSGKESVSRSRARVTRSRMSAELSAWASSRRSL